MRFFEQKPLHVRVEQARLAIILIVFALRRPVQAARAITHACAMAAASALIWRTTRKP